MNNTIQRDTCRRGHARTEENTYNIPSGSYHCIPCRKENYARWREKHLAEERARDRIRNSERMKQEDYREYMKERKEVYRKRHPIRTRARRLLQQAVSKGKIVKPKNCERCTDRTKLHGHHYDYLRAFDVLWVCTPCHEWLHHTKIKEVV